HLVGKQAALVVEPFTDRRLQQRHHRLELFRCFRIDPPHHRLVQVGLALFGTLSRRSRLGSRCLFSRRGLFGGSLLRRRVGRGGLIGRRSRFLAIGGDGGENQSGDQQERQQSDGAVKPIKTASGRRTGEMS